MGRLIEFLRSRAHLMLFILLEVIAAVFLLRSSVYRKSVFLSSASIVAGSFQEISHIANEYIGLKDANIELMKRNAQLEIELQTLRHQQSRLMVDSLSWSRLSNDSILRPFPYQYKVAKVVGNILFRNSNYLTLDIGTDQGIDIDMGVVSNEGVIGVVQAVGKDYAKVIPLINNQFNLNCKVSGSPHIGTLSWDGGDIEYSVLTNLPKHSDFQVGDSVITSGYSSIFPENLYVGQVVDEATSKNDHFRALKVKLGASFADLKYVYILQNFERETRREVEERGLEKRN
ncbi:rod shape-determining protein MreC [Porphyromonadaceae bacterium W3.11]|nr:rod shape-determining protein MreC [Porphyromonadaceae bacterium W3.11]